MSQNWNEHKHRVTLDTNDMLYDGDDVKEARDEGYAEGCTEGKR